MEHDKQVNSGESDTNGLAFSVTSIAEAMVVSEQE
jgi:hypothetical protein